MFHKCFDLRRKQKGLIHLRIVKRLDSKNIPSPKFDKIFNEDALGNYLSFQFVPTNETFFKGVFCLQPGHYFIYEDGKMEISRYFEPNFTGKYEKTFDEAAAEVEKVMKESVEKHKISDVEVASYLKIKV